MPPLLLLAAAAPALLTSAQPTSRILSLNDYPKDLMSRNAQGTVIYRAIVAPDGKPEQCTVIAGTGDKGFEKIPCANVMRRTRFTPARDQQGTPIYGVYTNIASFLLPEPGTVPPIVSLPPKMIVEIQKTAATPTDINVTVNVLADAEGKLTACTAGDDKAQAAFVRAACAQLSAGWAPSPIRNTAGEAVPAVHTAIVRFVPKE